MREFAEFTIACVCKSDNILCSINVDLHTTRFKFKLVGKYKVTPIVVAVKLQTVL